MTALQAIVAIITTAVICRAQTCIFDVPPAAGPNKDYSQNPAYQVGTVQQITWRMDVASAQLVFWQDNHPGDTIGGDHVILNESTSNEAFHWKVSYEGLDPSINNVFYFEVVAPNCTFTSHYFNLSGNEITITGTLQQSTIKPTDSSVSNSASSLSISAPSTSASSISTSSTSAITASPSTTSSSNGNANVSNPNIGLIVGVSVTTVLLFICIIGASAYFFRRWYRKRLSRQTQPSNSTQSEMISESGIQNALIGNRQEPMVGHIRELEVAENRHELQEQGLSELNIT